MAHRLELLPMPDEYLSFRSREFRGAASWLREEMPGWLGIVQVALHSEYNEIREAAGLLVGDLITMVEACGEAVADGGATLESLSDDSFAFEKRGTHVALLLETVDEAPSDWRAIREAYSRLARELGERIGRMDVGAVSQRVHDAATESIAEAKHSDARDAARFAAADTTRDPHHNDPPDRCKPEADDGGASETGDDCDHPGEPSAVWKAETDEARPE